MGAVKRHIFRRITLFSGLEKECYPQLGGIEFHGAAAYPLNARISSDFLIIFIVNIAARDLPTNRNIFYIIQALSC
jgi:hypothetical protein